MTTAADFILAARAYVGAPFRHQGRDGTGLDCAGLLIAAARDCGLPHPPALHYERLPSLELLRNLLPAFCVQVAEWEPAAIAQCVIGRRPQHLAVCALHGAHGRTLIHAMAGIERVAEHRLDDRWQRRIVRFWRLRGIEA
jgi:hypothetical protein